ncbi:MAG: pseudouridine synthase [Lachnospiraceae bacterium]|jgi:23S rRNA pseudouridine2604 synthase|nr:pseudouridine synthase [Lachnospiraceae bacterium]MCI1328596.1 pseudouridine synthase [Lachnospiraceae bacterium]
MRINKYLAACGLFSRRGADAAVSAGRVTIDGAVAEPGSRVGEESVVCVDGRAVRPAEEKIYLAFNKPRGIVCTASRKEPDNIIDCLNYPKRVTYAGRLDKWSEGLMLMTDDGGLIDAVMSAGDVHEKEYEVTVTETVRPEDLKEMEGGVFLPELGRTTRPMKVRQIDPHRFRVILTEGINREIRRICAIYGYRISRLRRVRIMNLELGNLKPGQYRELSKEEVRSLKEMAAREHA